MRVMRISLPFGSRWLRGLLFLLLAIVAMSLQAGSTDAQTCVPRPNVGVAVTPSLDGTLQVRLTAGAGQLREVRFGSATGALITVADRTNSPGNFSLTLAPNTQQLVFAIRPVPLGATMTVPLTVVDDCGEWRTFVGGGHDAWRALTPTATPSPTLTPTPSPTNATAAVSTGAGANVVSTVPPSAPASLQGSSVFFATVTAPGTTTFIQSTQPSGVVPPSSGTTVNHPYFDISTTATVSGMIDVELPYDPSVLGSADPSQLRFLHYENGSWVDRTTGVDTARHVVQGRVSSLSWLTWIRGLFSQSTPTPTRTPTATSTNTPTATPTGNAVALPTSYFLPFPIGDTWNLTWGPHDYADDPNSTTWSAVDLAPPGSGGVDCSNPANRHYYLPDRWVVAAADGTVIDDSLALVAIDHQDGWVTHYLHLSNVDKVAANTTVKRGDRLGHPSCEIPSGGFSTGVHVHFALYRAGSSTSTQADISGLTLSDWTITAGTTQGCGTMARAGVTKTASLCHGNSSDIENKGIQRAYLANSRSNDISVIDIINSPRRILTHIQVGNSPSDIVLSQSGQRAYVANFYSGSISVIDTSTNRVIDTIPLPASQFGPAQPRALALNSSGQKLYVLPMGGPWAVHVVDVASSPSTVTTILPNGDTPFDSPWGIVIHPDGTRVYATNQLFSRLWMLNAIANPNTLTPISISDGGLLGLSISSDGSRLYVVDRNGNQPSLRSFDTITNQYVVSDTISLDHSPIDVAVSSDNRRAYVTHYGGKLSVVDLVNKTVVHMLTDISGVVSNVCDISLDKSGRQLYISNSIVVGSATVSRVSVLDTQSYAIIDNIAVDPNACSITLNN